MEQNRLFIIDQFKKIMILNSKINRLLGDYIDPWKEDCNNYEKTYQTFLIKLAEINQIILDQHKIQTKHKKESN